MWKVTRRMRYAMRWILFSILLGWLCYLTYVPAPCSGTGEVQDDAIPLPIIMYHSVLTGVGQSGPYVIHQSALEADLQYLQANGFQTVTIGDLVAYVREGRSLPEKPVMLTFDDGHLNAKTSLLPLLEQYDMRAVVSVVGSYTEQAEASHDPNPAYAYLTWEDIHILQASGRIEIQNHSYALHAIKDRRGSRRKKGESLTVYRQIFSEDLGKMQRMLWEKAGVRANAFTYPFGFTCDDAEFLVKSMGFDAAMTCQEHVNWITRNPDVLYHLHRYNRPGNVSTAAFMRKISTT